MGETYFEYGKIETNWLKSRDSVLGGVIDRIGHIQRRVTPDLFQALIQNIIAQQISRKAKETICARVWERFSPITAESLAATGVEELQACGISMRKAAYIKGICETVMSGDLDLEHLRSLPDGEVVVRLTSLRGIGVWTAEMLMIFSLSRPDVLSRGDLGIIRGMRMLYKHSGITNELFDFYKEKYSPYATAASLYLWAVAGGACPELRDPAIGAYDV